MKRPLHYLLHAFGALAVSMLITEIARANDSSQAASDVARSRYEKLFASISNSEDDGPEPVALTLAEAVHHALINNPKIRAERRSVESSMADVKDAVAVYAPTVYVDLLTAEDNVPTSDGLAGVSGANAVSQRERMTANFALRKQLNIGTAFELAWRNARRTSNSTFESLSPVFEPTVGLRLRHPLLKNQWGIDARTLVENSRTDALRTAAAFEVELSRFVASTVEAYWLYRLAEADLAARQNGFDLAVELADEAEARAKVGTVAPLAVKEARADAAAREEELIAARHTLDLAARTLQYTVMLDFSRPAAPRPVVPADRIDIEPISIDRRTSLSQALDQRPEIRIAELRLENAKRSAEQTRVAKLPMLDLVGRYELVGLGGLQSSDPTGGSAAASIARIDGTALQRTEGDAYDDAIDVLATGDFFRYVVGLEFRYPIGNYEAKAANDRADIEVRRQGDLLDALASDIALEVERAVGDLEAADKRVAAATLARELAEENLKSQKKRYDLGMGTTTDILDFQRKVTTTMAAEARAKLDHALAVTNLRIAEGDLLAHYDIEIERPDEPGRPWWARF